MDDFLQSAPLPERMRPEALDQFVGQAHLVGPGRLLRRLVDSRKLISFILWGPPGTGKTTLAKLIAQHAQANLVELSAVSSGTKEMREVFTQAAEEKRLYGTATVLFVDEVHRYTKTQQDVLLPALERGIVYLIGSTTENPRICLTSALLSRVQVFQLYPLPEEVIEKALLRALHDPVRGLGAKPILVSDEAMHDIVNYAGGDLRKALHALEWAVMYAESDVAGSALMESASPGGSGGSGDGRLKVAPMHVKEATQGTHGRFDENIQYDMISAFCKSLRGSDSDAALYWFMRLVDAGVDPRIPVRRLIVHASEDVGLASPQALQQAVAAMQVLLFVGFPEASIPIAQAIIFVCESPKSNSVVMALGAVEEAIAKTQHAAVPTWLRDKHFSRADDGSKAYMYPHDYPSHYVMQQYLPDELAQATFYNPTDQGTEAKIHPRKRKG